MLVRSVSTEGMRRCRKTGYKCVSKLYWEDEYECTGALKWHWTSYPSMSCGCHMQVCMCVFCRVTCPFYIELHNGPTQPTSGALYPAVPIVTCFFWYLCSSLLRVDWSTEESKSVRATLKDCRGLQQHRRGEEHRQLADRPMRMLLAACGEEQRW